MSAQSDFAAIARRNGRAALATVVVAPEDSDALGSKLLVREDGSTEGSLGDEGLDLAAREAADELLWAERSELREQGDVSLFVDVTFPPPG